MKELKETLENTLINNLECEYPQEFIRLESIQTCADYISKEIVELMVDWGRVYHYHPIRATMSDTMVELYAQELAETYLTERYKNKV
jgi:hypothetical protein